MIRQANDTALVRDTHPLRTNLTAADLCLLVLLGLIQLTLCFIRSHGRLFWSDELYGIQVLADHSFTHMFVGWREGADGGGFFYYLFARLWLDLAGFSELTLRLFSAFGMITSVVCIWLIGRRFYGVTAMAVGVSLVYLTTPVLLWQTVNGRFYGLFLAAAALASLAFFNAAERDHLSRLDLLFVAISHALLCGSHILGMVYSAALIVAMFAADRARHRWRPSLTLAALAGWLILPFSYRAIVNSTSIASNLFWTQKPSVKELFFATFLYGKPVRLAALALLLCWAVTAFYRRGTPNLPPASRLPVFIFGGALFLAEMVLFLKSRLFGISIFADRYLVPLSLAAVLVLAELFTRAFSSRRHGLSRIPILALLAILLGGVVAFRQHPYAAVYPSQGLAQRIAERLPPGETVVVTSPAVYLFLTHYEPTHHYLYPVDWNYDLSPSQFQKDHSDTRLMENWLHAGYDTQSILPCTQILQQQSSFTLLSNNGRRDWIARRLASPRYDTQVLGDFTEWSPFTLYHATLRGTPAPCN